MECRIFAGSPPNPRAIASANEWVETRHGLAANLIRAQPLQRCEQRLRRGGEDRLLQ